MIFYRVTLRSVPDIIFACRVDIENYRNRFPFVANLLELSVCEEGEIFFQHDNGEREIVYPGMLMPIFKDMVCTSGMVKPGRQKHITVGVVAEYELERYDTETAEEEKIRQGMETGHTFLIPYRWDLWEKHETVIRLLERIAQNAFERQGGKQILAISDWYRLCGELSEMVLKKLDKTQQILSPYGIRYAEQARAYMHENYQKSLSVAQIAEYLGISCGYLHDVFRKSFRCGIMEYLNGYRVQMAMQYIRSRGMTLKAAAELVGIGDEAYMSRLFRKKTGMSYREFLTANGMGKGKG